MVPPLHSPVVAPPLTLPASVTAGLVAHTVSLGPAFAIAAGLIVPLVVQGRAVPPRFVSVRDKEKLPVV